MSQQPSSWLCQQCPFSERPRDRYNRDEPIRERTKRQLPFKTKVIKALGLNNYINRKFIFNPQPSRYRIFENRIHMVRFNYLDNISNHQQVSLDKYLTYMPPKGYEYQALTLNRNQNQSIPLVYLKRIQTQKTMRKKCPTVIYSHGNSSDLYDSLKFIDKICKKWQEVAYKEYIDNQADMEIIKKIQQFYPLQFVIYDYTGYGQSVLNQKDLKKNKNINFRISQETINNDLQSIISWLQKPVENIILWGFSLGTVPVINSSIQHSILGTIIQSPFTSISNCMNSNEDITDIPYQNDLFNNLQKFGEIKADKVLIMHGQNDQIFPIKHAQVLYKRYVSQKQKKYKQQFGQNSSNQKINLILRQKIYFIKAQNMTHNSMHQYLSSRIPDQLQKQLFLFVYRCYQQLVGRQYGNRISRKSIQRSLTNISLQKNRNSCYLSTKEQEFVEQEQQPQRLSNNKILSPKMRTYF